MDIHQFEPLWGSWYIREGIGKGSYGVIYRIEQKIMDCVHENALKYISIPNDESDLWMTKNSLNPADASDIQALLDDSLHDILNEYNNLQQFSGHRNFVQVHDILSAPKKDIPGYDVFIRMELLNNINTRFRSDHLDEPEVVRLGINICSALNEMHKQNLIHRDIKPQNILVSKDGIYKLSDLGSVRKFSGSATAITMKGAFDYTAPEILIGSPADSRADIYSLGIVMYQLLNNFVLPPARMPGDQLSLPHNISPDLSQIVLKACEYYPDKRWNTAEEMLDALQQLENTNKAESQTSSMRSAKDSGKDGTTVASDSFSKQQNLKTSVAANTQENKVSFPAKEAKIDNSIKHDNATLHGDVFTPSFKGITGENNKTKRKLRIPIIAFCVVLLAALSVYLSGMLDNTIAHGKWGTCDWKIQQDGTLVITAGTGSDTGYQNVPWIDHEDAIHSITTDGTVKAPKVCSYLFSNLDNCTKMDLSNFDTSNVTDMSCMFSDCRSLTPLNLSSFDTSNVTDMSCMFYNCTSLSSIDLSNFDTSSVFNMSVMFASCTNLSSIDLSNFNTHNVTNMSGMFSDCTSLSFIDLSNFNTHNVTDMSGMFSSCTSLSSIDLSSFDTGNVTNMHTMFYTCTSLVSLNLSSFDTSNVTDMSWMFADSRNLSFLNLSSFNTSNVTDMSYMFYICESLSSLNLNSFDTRNVIDMSNMFSLCSNLSSLDIINFNYANVTDRSDMFNGCYNLSITE